MKKNSLFKKSSKEVKKFFNVTFFSKIGAFTVLFMLGFYLFQVTEMTKEIHVVREYDNEMKRIQEKSRKTEYSFLRANSLSRAEDFVETMGFQKVNNVHHIQISGTQIAAR